MGSAFSCASCQDRSPPPRMARTRRQSDGRRSRASSKTAPPLTTTTTEAADSTTTIQSLDGRTTIVMYGHSHEDPLRYHPVTRSRGGMRKSVYDKAIDGEEKCKRKGLVFVEEMAGSSREEVAAAAEDSRPLQNDNEKVTVEETKSEVVVADDSRQCKKDADEVTVKETQSEVVETSKPRLLP